MARRTGTVALLVLALSTGWFVSPAAAANGTLSGTVTASEGGPLAGITVEALDWLWGIPVASTATGADGTWNLSVPPGWYRIRYSDPAGVRADRYSGDTPDWASSSAVEVTDAGTTTDDATLPARDTIVGTVTDPGGAPVAGITVELLWQGWAIKTTVTGADGTYELAGINSGTWTLGFRDPNGTWATEYSGGSNTATGATPITTTGDTTHTVDHTAHHGGSITGRARMGTTGPWLAGIYALALDADTFELLGATVTDATSTWSIPNLAPGDVKVAYLDPAATGPTPGNAYRVVFKPQRDVGALGLAGAYNVATRYTVTSGGNRATGAEPLRGWHCDPTTHHPGADLAGQNLSLQNLRGCDLHDAEFDDAWLSYTHLEHANLSGAALTSLNSSGPYLQGANLTGAQISGTALHGTSTTSAGGVTVAQLLSTDHDWTGVRLTDFDLAGHDFVAGGFTFGDDGWIGWPYGGGTFLDSDLSGANFAGLDLTGVGFVGSNLSNTDFTGATLERAAFYTGSCCTDADSATDHSTTNGMRITGADLSDAAINPWQIFVANRDLTDTDLANITDTWRGSLESGGFVPPWTLGWNWAAWGFTLTGADLSRDFDNTGFSPSSLSLAGGNFAGMDLTGFACKDCDLTGADLAGADLSDGDLTGVTGNPAGGSTAVYSNTTCPNGEVTNGTTITTCVGRGLSA